MIEIDIEKLMTQYTAIGQNIRDIRKANNITQLELGLYTDISQSQISRIEKGQEPASILELMKISAFLMVTPNQLMGYDSQDDLFGQNCSEDEKAHRKRIIEFDKKEYQLIISHKNHKKFH